MTSDPSLKHSDIDRMPLVEIVAAPSYYIGLPIIISVTWDNRSSITQFYRMPILDLTFTRGGDISVAVVPTGSEGARLETGFARNDEEGEPVAILNPGEKRRMVCDLSNMGVVFQPGSYAITLTLNESPDSRASNTVHTTLKKLSEADERESIRLRKLGDSSFDTGAWRPFLELNVNTVKVAPSFNPRAKEQLALHLFLHRAIWIPGTLDKVDPALLAAIHGAHLDAEVAALKYEILSARKDPHLAAERKAMLTRFPGLEHRVQQADRGKGFLAVARSVVGAEATFPNPLPHWPYRP